VWPLRSNWLTRIGSFPQPVPQDLLVDLSLGSLSLDVRSAVLDPHSGNAGMARTFRGIAGILAPESGGKNLLTRVSVAKVLIVHLETNGV